MGCFSVNGDDVPFSGIRFVTPPRVSFWNHASHWQPPPLMDYDLWVIMEGRGTLCLRGEEFTLTPGCCFVFTPGDRPDVRHDPDHPLVVFYCHFDMLDGRGRRLARKGLRVPLPNVQARDLGLLLTLVRSCVASYRRNDALGQRQSRVMLESVLLLVWEWAFLPPPQACDSRIDDIIHAVERKPGSAWSVAEMARLAHLSKSQFTRRCRALTGVSPREFVIRTRLNTARQLVRETRMKLAEIAAELGYCDIYFFSRQFKQHFGRPPSDFRPKRLIARQTMAAARGNSAQ